MSESIAARPVWTEFCRLTANAACRKNGNAGFARGNHRPGDRRGAEATPRKDCGEVATRHFGDMRRRIAEFVELTAIEAYAQLTMAHS